MHLRVKPSVWFHTVPDLGDTTALSEHCELTAPAISRHMVLIGILKVTAISTFLHILTNTSHRLRESQRSLSGTT